jgi:hypothetical protein
VSFYNRSAGFYQNHHPVNNYYYNNTAYKNGVNFNMLGYDLATGNDSIGMGIYKNNAAFSGTATSNASGADAAYNSWDIPGLTVSASDFESIDTAAGIYAPRKADGSLPDVKFMHLSTGSGLIDKGVNVGLPYSGSAPDLGAFETGMTRVADFLFQSKKARPVFFWGNNVRGSGVFDVLGRESADKQFQGRKRRGNEGFKCVSDHGVFRYYLID